MNLLLWRHAEAEDIGVGGDLERRLTPKGEKQAANMARWLRKHAPADLLVLSSPAVRTRQTAAALDLPVDIVRSLATDATPEALIAAAGWPDGRRGEAVLLVGHQPTLGMLAARLLTGVESPWAVKKGALWWLQGRARGRVGETSLKLVLPPEFA